MKIRNGHVSNSSSSSFVLYIPTTLDIDKYILSKKESFLDTLKDNEAFYDNEELFSDHDNGIYDDEKLFAHALKEIKEAIKSEDSDYTGIVTDIFDDFIISSASTGPDGGGFAIVTEKDFQKVNDIVKGIK